MAAKKKAKKSPARKAAPQKVAPKKRAPARKATAKPAPAKGLKVGDAAPDFTLPTDGTGQITLSALRGKLCIERLRIDQ